MKMHHLGPRHLNWILPFQLATLTLQSCRCLALLALVALAAETSPAQTARRIVSDNGDPILYPSYLVEYNGQLYFRANNLPHGNNVELWAFDGAVARMVADINPGTTGSDPSYLAVYDGRLYFCASTGGASKLWQYDSTNGASLAPGAASLPSLPQDLFAFGGALYFRAARFGAPGNIGIELWKFDGATQTPLDLFAGTGSSNPQHFIEYQGLLYFNANGMTNQGTELWRHSGTGMPAEAARIYPNNGSSPENFALFNGQLYFSAYDGLHGRELWRFDGTNASLAADIVPGGQYSSSNPGGLTVYNGRLYFSATDEIHGYELWSYDGTNAQMVAEINPTPDPGNGDTFLMDSSPGGFKVFDGLLYFAANDGVHGRELWSFDGATARLVLDLNPGEYGSEVSELTVFQGSLFFSGDDGYVPGLSALEPQVFALAPAAPLCFATPQLSAGKGLTLTLRNSDETSVTTNQLARLQIYTSTHVADPLDQWQRVTNPITLKNGAAEVSGLETTNASRRFFRAILTP